MFGDDGGYIYLYSGPFLIKKTRADDIDNEIYKYVMEHGYDTGIICILDVLILLMIILAIKNSKKDKKIENRYF